MPAPVSTSARSGIPSARGRRRTAVRLAAAYAVGLALLVLTPISDALLRLTLDVGDVWAATGLPGGGRVFVVGAVLNVVLFVPLGYALVALLRRPWWQAALLAVALSGCIELVQLLPVLDRDATVADVVSNGLGGLLGAVLATALRRRPAIRIPVQAPAQARAATSAGPDVRTTSPSSS